MNNYKGVCEICNKKHIISSNSTKDICSYCKVLRPKAVKRYFQVQEEKK